MVIFGIQVSTEAVAAILFAFAGVLTGYGLLLRASAKKIEANAKEIEAQARATSTNAEADFTERQFIIESHKRQIVINDQLAERLSKEKELYEQKLKDKEAQDESNYRVLQQTQDRIGQELHGVLRTRFDALDVKIDGLPAKLQEDNKEWMRTLVGELVTQMAERFAELTLSQEWYPFPDVNDAEWREEFVKPLVNKVRLYRRPVLSESSVTDIAISPGGETMKIIQGRKKKWLLVRLLRENTEALYGWLPEHEVITGMTAIKKVTSEVQAANGALSAANNPIPAT